jgi:hypothetical protein
MDGLAVFSPKAMTFLRGLTKKNGAEEWFGTAAHHLSNALETATHQQTLSRKFLASRANHPGSSAAK